MDPDFTPSGHSVALLAPELTWVGPSFSPGAPSLLKAVTAFPLHHLTTKSTTKPILQPFHRENPMLSCLGAEIYLNYIS